MSDRDPVPSAPRRRTDSRPTESRTVLVTGAMGQVGKRVTRLLLARDRTVVALDLRSPAAEAVAADMQPERGSPGRLVPAYADLLDPDRLAAVVAEHRPDAVVHLAAAVAPTAYLNPRQTRRINVDGTRNLVTACQTLGSAPLFVEASSASVYGSRNPHTHSDRLTAATPASPVDCYGEDKVRAEAIVAASGLPHATLRLGAVISSDAITTKLTREIGVLRRALPRDNRIHTVDARDASLAFANAVDRGPAIDGKVLLIGGDETHLLLQGELEDDIMAALGLGRIGERGGLPGDPDDDHGWGLTDWFDTTESQALLGFQEHPWPATCGWLAEAAGRRRTMLQVVGPALRPLLRIQIERLRAKEGRGPFADPWRLIEQHFGPDVLAPTTW